MHHCFLTHRIPQNYLAALRATFPDDQVEAVVVHIGFYVRGGFHYLFNHVPFLFIRRLGCVDSINF